MNRIRELRLQKNLTQDKLGKLLNRGTTAISKYELEQLGLDEKIINQLCDFFGCTADYLLCRSDSPTAAITDEDAALLRAYHAADEHTKALVRLALEPFSASKTGRQVS